MTVKRTDHWNRVTQTPRGGATSHGESLTDMERYLLPMDRARTAGLHGWGVNSGLRVVATGGQPGVKVLPGTAVDAEGRVTVLAAGGVAIVDPTVDPNDVENIPTVTVPADGLVLPTAGLSGDHLLTLTWREVADAGAVSTAPALLHAPWLRLVPAAGFHDVGEQVVLGAVSMEASGAVTALTTGPRRLAEMRAGRVELRVPHEHGGAESIVDQAPAAELLARPEGGVELNLLGASAARPALSVTTAGDLEVTSGTLRVAHGDLDVLSGALRVSKGDVEVASGALRVSKGDLEVTSGTLRVADGDLEVASGDVVASSLQVSGTPGVRTFRLASGTDRSLRVRDLTAGADRLVIDQAGRIAIGPGQAQRILHVEGSEVHSGGAGGGFSFADRSVGGFAESPGSGERWVWYAVNGSARLWSGMDRLSISTTGEGGALDVPRRMRVRQGGDSSAGIWLHQSGPDADRAFVGMVDDTRVGFWGNTGAGWGLHMNTTSGHVRVSGGLDVTRDATVGAGGSGTLTVRGNTTVTGRQLTVGTIGVPSWSGGGLVAWDVFARGGMYVGNDPHRPRCTFYADGTKRFVIDHPLHPGRRTLTHACIEGPEAAVYYRGEGRLARGTAHVTLPEYFESLVRAEGRTVMLTAVSSPGEPITLLAATAVQDGGFTVTAGDDRNRDQRFCWEVKGTRADVDPLVAEAEAIPMALDAAAPTMEP